MVYFEPMDVNCRSAGTVMRENRQEKRILSLLLQRFEKKNIYHLSKHFMLLFGNQIAYNNLRRIS